MADQTLLELLQELVESYDDTISTSSGSSFRTTVIDPFLSRVGDSPLDTDLEEFLAARVAEEIEDLDTSTFSGIRDLVIRPMAVMLAPLRREINAIKLSQSLTNYDQMTRTELNALLGNFFLSIQDGDVASGTARVYFSAPQSTVVTSLTKFSTEAGLNFYPSQVVAISATSMTFNQEGSYYYVDVDVESEAASSDYNISAGEISVIDGLAGAVKVTNKLAFSSATDDETKEEAVSRAQDSITIRNLSTSRGIETLLSSEFPSIDTLQVIGFGEDEMIRDVVTGPSVVSGVPGGFSRVRSPDIDTGVSIHIGGKTDVYIYQTSRVSTALDITNITDVGTRVLTSLTGYTNSSSATDRFYDERGYFETLEATAGDYLRLGEDEIEILSVVGENELQMDATMEIGLFEQEYEIIRYTDDGDIQVPIYDLVALDEDGEPVTNDDGDPVKPIPGSPILEPLVDSSGDYVAKEDNVSSSNVSLPLMMVTSVEFLNPSSLEQTGEYAPLAETLLAKIQEVGVTAGAITSGTVRIYFKDACTVKVPSFLMAIETDFEEAGLPTTFSIGPREFFASGASSIGSTPTDVQYPSGSGNVVEVALLSGAPEAGQWISLKHTGSVSGTGTPETKGKSYLIESVAVGGVGHRVTVRWGGASGTYAFDNPTGFNILVNNGCVFYQGVFYEDMLYDDDYMLYYLDVAAAWPDVDADGESDLDEDRLIDNTANVYVEGYNLRSYSLGDSYSTREKPYLTFTEYVLDSNLRIGSTAPAVRVAYDHADTLELAQAFVEDDDNRIVAEDVLVKHFLPALVRSTITATGIDDTTGLEVVEEFINSVDPQSDLEVSDLVAMLYENGASYVQLPISLSVIHHMQDRVVRCEISQNSIEANRLEQMLMDAEMVFTGYTS